MCSNATFVSHTWAPLDFACLVVITLRATFYSTQQVVPISKYKNTKNCNDCSTHNIHFNHLELIIKENK